MIDDDEPFRIKDKDTADDVKYHLMAENPPEPRARDCWDFIPLSDGSKLCRYAEHTVHSLCENIVKNGECPKGCRE